MAGTLTATAEASALDWLFTTGSPTRPTTWFVALHTGANGGAGAANEISGMGYARQPVTWSRTGNVASNTALLTFGPDATTSWGTVTDVTVWDLVTAGTCLAQGTATASVSFGLGESATIGIGALTIQLT
jgi:hypothetical protein